MKTFTLSLLAILFAIQSLFAQVAINNDGSAADSSAMLEVKATSKGVLFPRMTTLQRNSISSPATGLLVFDTNENLFYYYTGSQWTKIKSGTVLWSASGNDVTASDTSYNVGIGTSTPSGRFEVSTVIYGHYGSDVCTGGTSWASSTTAPNNADLAFDNDNNTYWESNNVSPNILMYYYGAGDEKTVQQYRIYFKTPGTTYNHAPKDWTLEASNDSSTWTTLDTRINELWTADEWKEYTFGNSTPYRYYKLNITDNKGFADARVQINELELKEEELLNDHTLVVNDNKVGMGTASPSATLDVNGSLKFTDGNEADGKVLVSDASGNSTWTDGATVNGGGWTVSGNYIYNNTDSIGIGTTAPNAKFEVNGDIVIGSGSSTPTAGMIRWNSNTKDFEGYNGSNWVSLTNSTGGWSDNSVSETESGTASDGTAFDYFGVGVSIDGNYAIAGAVNKSIGGNTSQGKAYIFYRSGTSWSQQAGLTASDGAADDFFGESVSINGDYAIVGAYYKDIGGNNHQGKAYIFHRSGTSWSQQAGLTASDGAAEDFFGKSVSINGDYAIVGAYYKDIGGNNHQGKAYIFHRSGTSWSQQAELTASDGDTSDNFGYSVSINGNYAIVGARYKDIGGNAFQGKAYIFYRSGTSWSQQAELTASDGAANDKFGYSVSINGDYAIIGANGKDVGGNTGQGKAYIFYRNGTSWSQQAGLIASEGANNDNFGWSVSINGDYAIIGAKGKDVGDNSNQGKAYVFYRSGTSWILQTTLTASDGANDDLFGSVSNCGDDIIVGAYNKDVGGNSNQGKTYFYKRYD